MLEVYQCSKIQEKLPLLEYVETLFSAISLRKAILVGCQHILPSVHFLVRSMISLGLFPENVALIGKCYSTSKATYQAMRKEGIYICPSSLGFDSHQSFDTQFRNNLSSFFEHVLSNTNISRETTIILLDDGSELISIAEDFFEGYFNIFGVEQTSSGYYKLIQTPPKIPVINVARSDVKLNVESPMIANSQMKQLKKKIQARKLAIKKCLLIGKGAIGNSLYDLLIQDYDVQYFDIIKERTEINKSELNLKNYDLIVGTTGVPVITERDYDDLKVGTCLVSASSSDVEFDAVKLRRWTERTDDCHKDIFVREIFLPNCGFPINFYETNEDNVPLEDIQLTTALLLAGVCQGIMEKYLQPGMVDLHRWLQERILMKFYEWKEFQVVLN